MCLRRSCCFVATAAVNCCDQRTSRPSILDATRTFSMDVKATHDSTQNPSDVVPGRFIVCDRRTTDRPFCRGVRLVDWS